MSTQVRVRVQAGIAAGLPAPGPVVSVAGRTGAVVLDVSDVAGLSASLAGKAPINSPTFTGTVSGITASMVGAPSGSGTSSGTNTGDETETRIGTLIAAAASKASPADADMLGLADSAAGNLLRKLLWADVKSALNLLYVRLAVSAQIISGKLGIGMSPTALLHLAAGTAAANSAPLKLSSGPLMTIPEAGAIERYGGLLYHTADDLVRSAIATEDVAQPIGDNLLVNGDGRLGNNRNFPSYIYDKSERHVSGVASFRINVSLASLTTSDFIKVSTDRRTRISLWAKAGDIGGGNYNASNKQFFGVAFYDIDRLLIYSQHAISSANATLLAPLIPGDTTVSLSSASGWNNGPIAQARILAWYGYTDSTGYTYPDYTYTRNVTGSGAWPEGGIVGNTITLTAPWSGPPLPAGAAVSNRPAGNVYNHNVASNVTLGTEWAYFEGYLDGSGSGITNYRHGAAYIRFGHLVNYHGLADTNIRLCNVKVTQASSANLEAQVGIGTSYKNLLQTSLPSNGLAVEGRTGCGTSSPSAQMHVMAAGEQLRLGYDAATYTSFTVGATGGVRLSSGLTFRPPVSGTPATNGDLTFEATTNTSITIRYRGSDGTVRSAVLPLT